MPNKLETVQVTRREFLGAAALTAAQYKRVLGANDRIGIGFIGFGLIGKQHVTDFKKFGDVDLVGLCDVYKPRLEEGLNYVGNPRAKGYSDFRKMYENKDIQGVVVATPDHWHALLTIMACAAGKDVYVEKPMTLFIDEGRWMIQAARKYNRIVVVGTQRRHGKVLRRPGKSSKAASLGRSIPSESPPTAIFIPDSAGLPSKIRRPRLTTTCGSVPPPRSRTRSIAPCTISAGSGTIPAAR